MAIPSRLVHWYTFAFYLLCTLGHALTVKWTDMHLTGALDDLVNPKSNSPTIIAIFNSPRLGSTSLPGFVNGCLIMSVVSAAATSLYIASRTLYGLVYSLRGSNWVSSQLKTLGTIWRSTHVPSKALLATVLVFYWLPWLYQIPNNKVTVDDVISLFKLSLSS
jgi:yeast amino acid transporter